MALAWCIMDSVAVHASMCVAGALQLAVTLHCGCVLLWQEQARVMLVFRAFEDAVFNRMIVLNQTANSKLLQGTATAADSAQSPDS